MKKLRCLLLDACVVIKLFQLGLWQQFCERCEVVLAETVVEDEVQFYVDADEQRHEIDLSEDLTAGRIAMVSVDASAVGQFFDRFDRIYAEQLDPGERESLAYLFEADAPCTICSSDAIVFRVLAWTGRQDQGLSLEEILQAIGLGRSLPHQYTKPARLKWTRQGEEDMVRGIGMKR